ncbi:cyun145 [Cyclophragma undans nucleopolyhedrovirus]|uniref:Cyun145 n=1 Tax=Cyclophragma undans nucleopolyhedrovirus TaxID=1906244 RepID=A0A288QD81_9ABAC|nr:cyun145 [Cyclophragma undans nucleopolyhedrovirus]AOT85603.1 cyun145 [Cyclophragma undans nucleopolyhedrovirus]
MYPKTPLTGARIHDSDKTQMLRRELNSLRRNVHEMCTRSLTNTNFDCSKLLNGDENAPVLNYTATTLPPMAVDKIVETTKLASGGATKRTVVDSLAPMRTVITNSKYDECVV